MRHIIKKGDIILAAAIIAVALAGGFLMFNKPAAGKTVTIQVGDEVYGEYPLGKNITVKLEHNTVVIKNGEVRISEADCPDRVCVNTGGISKAGERIICLPNSVIVEVR